MAVRPILPRTVDLFVCNLDRFDWENFDEAQGLGVTWANRGNLIFVAS